MEVGTYSYGYTAAISYDTMVSILEFRTQLPAQCFSVSRRSAKQKVSLCSMSLGMNPMKHFSAIVVFFQ